MKDEEKALFVKDLCVRLLYGVKCYVDDPLKGKLTVIPHSMLDMDGFECHTEDWEYEQFYSPDELTPYLRPLSSMTEDEYNEYENYILNEKDELIRFCNSLTFYNKYHFDYRGLIERGLALEAPENMYKHFGDMDVVVTSVEHKDKL